ncbi:Retinoblastoma-related protein [Hibiscus syriacus]|uniref:Retinoblastoma-related protein n=1 Tax=Hibiscus syriacus TaxID=106335 RepID=A0A6A3BCI9_HIBSY|nr:retinoblastoma-related protein-like isoform X1 [Hibiscus syriacus]KAE8714740.1 Retinoblastoma-related protein [Hibiscus syriacus]
MNSEGMKPSVTTSGSTDDDAIETRFTAFCKNGLSLEEKACSNAMKLFKETKHLLSSNVSAIGSGTLEEAERFWFSFVLYSFKRLSEKIGENKQHESDESGFSLCHILRATKLNIVDFFKELPQFVVKAGPVLSNMYGEDWESKLEAKEMQANFVHLSLISKSFKRAFWELFLASDANVDKQQNANSSPDYLSDCHRFGWLLFLALRVHAFSRFKDLVTCANGFVSILVILIIHVPIRFRNFKISDTPRFVKKGDKGIDLLASLCNMYDASEDDLRKTMEMANKLIEDILRKKPCPAAECKMETLENIDTDGLIYFEGLMEEQSLSSCLNILEKDYDDAICNKGDLDERVFVNEEDSLLGLGSLSGGAMNVTGIKRKLDSMASPSKSISSPLSPQRPPATHVNGVLGSPSAKMAATPVSTAMTTAKWLRSVICPLPSKPSAELQCFLSSCDKDVTNDVICRAHIILEAIFPRNHERSATGSLQSVNLMDNIWMEQRRLEALKLYYRVLEAMCTAEVQILHAVNLTSLLTNERFHRCMLACSAELVLATHKTATMLFPTVLERTGITAFDLSKVIESFIRHEESLPRELRRHLNSLEERLLESMVWSKGSSMYNSLIVARPSLSAEINRLGLLAEPMPLLDAIAMHVNSSGGTPPVSTLQKHETSTGQNGDVRSPMRPCAEFRSVLIERNAFTSPVKDRLLALSNLKKAPLQSAFASPTRPNPGGGGETCAEIGINIFFSKINKLAAIRINGMVERLQLSQQIRESLYHLFQQILIQRTSLFFNRHIDQIILCCFYVVAKISQLRLTFKEIICNYRKQPQCKPQVFQSVFINRSSARPSGRTGQDNIDIIAFYNEIFIPAVKPLLGELGSAGTTTRTSRVAEANNSNDGPCPGSPKVSPFPNLPDMSPKKVSATHNVYVSPLRTSKMDALISHSSRSYYACVGESTRAFQSPSKDLTAINNHLNGSRKIRGALNFDDIDVGLVSDSMVANSLYLQNGSCTSSSGAPLKSEQPES